MGLTFDTSTSLFECVDVGVNTTFTVQLVPSQVPRQEALLEEEKNCSRTVLGISDKSMELTIPYICHFFYTGKIFGE